MGQDVFQAHGFWWPHLLSLPWLSHRHPGGPAPSSWVEVVGPSVGLKVSLEMSGRTWSGWGYRWKGGTFGDRLRATWMQAQRFGTGRGQLSLATFRGNAIHSLSCQSLHRGWIGSGEAGMQPPKGSVCQVLSPCAVGRERLHPPSERAHSVECSFF